MTRTVRLALLVAVGLLLVVGCQSAPGAPAATGPAGAVVISAGEITFDQASVTAPSGEAFTLWFENRVPVPHNVHVVAADGTSIARGEVFSGPASQELAVPALGAGTYTIVCDVHPGMTAELVAN